MCTILMCIFRLRVRDGDGESERDRATNVNMCTTRIGDPIDSRYSDGRRNHMQFLSISQVKERKRFNVKVIGENLKRCAMHVVAKGLGRVGEKLSAFYFFFFFVIDWIGWRTCANRNGKLDLQQSVIDCRLSIYCVRVFKVIEDSREMHATSEFVHRRTCWNERSSRLAYLLLQSNLVLDFVCPSANGWLAGITHVGVSFVARNEMQSFLCGWSVHSLYLCWAEFISVAPFAQPAPNAFSPSKRWFRASSGLGFPALSLLFVFHFECHITRIVYNSVADQCSLHP